MLLTYSDLCAARYVLINILMFTINDILKNLDMTGNKYVSTEFQDFGIRLADELGDQKHRSLYIKLAKNEPRQRLEDALSFVKDSNARNRARLFMWKVKELRTASAQE